MVTLDDFFETLDGVVDGGISAVSEVFDLFGENVLEPVSNFIHEQYPEGSKALDKTAEGLELLAEFVGNLEFEDVVTKMGGGEIVEFMKQFETDESKDFAEEDACEEEIVDSDNDDEHEEGNRSTEDHPECD